MYQVPRRWNVKKTVYTSDKCIQAAYKPYQDNFTPENGLYLDYFRFNGRNYAVEQFLCLGNPFWNPVTYCYEDKNGKTCYLSGVDNENYFNPIYVEFDEYCENVRVYVED